MPESLRQPRSLVRLNGVAYGPLSWETDSNSFYQADTFRAVFAVANTPGLESLGNEEQIDIEILGGFPSDPDNYSPGDLSSVFAGRVDDVDIDLIARTVTLTGRDLTGALIDVKTSEKYVAKTASDIATVLAGKHGLTPVVTATTTIVGRYYQQDKGVRLQDENTEWDLLTWLAREENFVCYVQGKELHFEPAPDEAKSPVLFRYTVPDQGGPISFDGTKITLGRSLTLAKGIKVEVSSWQPKSKKVVRRVATRGGGSDPQKYAYSIPNLTADQARQRANKILADLSRHELKIGIDGPAAALAKTDLIQLTGTGSAWDTVYHPATVSRSFDMDGGYTWRIDAKNHNTESTATL